MSTQADQSWRQSGQDDPYYAVLTDARFRRSQLTAEHRQAFFETGRQHVDWVFGLLGKLTGPGFRPARALDFGCGVGRLVIPLAERCQAVVGVDVAPGMLAEARQNCAERHLENVSFVLSDATLSQVTGSFDLIHSYIVFQHIPVAAGRALLRQLVSHLEEGGSGALEFLLHRDGSRLRLLGSWLETHVPLFHRGVNLVRGRPWSEPLMQMNIYTLNALLMDLYAAACDDIQVHLVPHPGAVGAMILFRKHAALDKTPRQA